MSLLWLKSAIERARLEMPLVLVQVEVEGISFFAEGHWSMRTWQMIADAKTDLLTPTVDAIRARAKRVKERGPQSSSQAG